MIVYAEQLTDDRDAYLALATQLSEGNGYRFSAEGPPTAYRPPLYPLVLGAFLKIFSPSFSVAFVNGLCGLMIVGLTWKIARQVWNNIWSCMATVAVICDPLLLINVTLPMTEVMFTALVLAVLYLSTRPEQTLGQRVCLGFCFGLAALCRPTIWPFGALAAVVCIWTMSRANNEKQGLRLLLRRGGPVLMAVCLTVAPWIVRNAIVFQAFIPMTTHGGYTLLLANNPVFYDEVVSEGWRTTWQEDSLDQWQEILSQEMRETVPPIEGELSTNQWMTQRAINVIRSDGSAFLQSCRVRFLRFWNPVPMSTSTRPVPRVLQWGIGFFSLTLFAGAIAGLLMPLSSQNSVRLPVCFPSLSLILLVSFSLIHTVYWSNLRMRTPLEPVLILLAVSAFYGCFSRLSPRGTSQPQ